MGGLLLFLFLSTLRMKLSGEACKWEKGMGERELKKKKKKKIKSPKKIIKKEIREREKEDWEGGKRGRGQKLIK